MSHSVSPLIDVYRSERKIDCDNRAFVLTAVNIPSAVDFDGEAHVVRVAPAWLAHAQHHLWHYETERRSRAVELPPLPRFARAWVGGVVYCIVLLTVALAVANGWWRLDLFSQGELNAGLVRSGQWWRATTALTLHLDAAHLLANLGAGMWFGFLAARQLGAGSAWFLTLGAAALANLLESYAGPVTHRAVGASTAVFAALGLLAAHTWHTRRHAQPRWAARIAPLVAGSVLLGWLGTAGEGTAGEGTDVVAHLLGFAMGTVCGALVALPMLSRSIQRLPQWLWGMAALLLLVVGWTCALLA
jgi:rhomboid protease GluP